MKILVVTNLYPSEERPSWGTFVKEQVDSLRLHGVSVDVFVVRSYRSRMEYLRAMSTLPRLVKSRGYDLVHAHYGLTLLSLLFVGAPVVATFHGTDLLVSPVKHLCKLLARKASRSIVVGQRLKDELGYGEVIPCGIDVERFAYPDDHPGALLPPPPGVLRVLFPANPSVKVKDYGLFQAVCRELERRGSRVEPVHLVNVARSQVPSLFWDCDLMLLTSLSEGSPTVVKEAIAAKLPFVSVNVGDVREWAGLVGFGAVAKDRDPARIAELALSLLARVGRRPQLDNSGCLERIDLARIAGRVRGLYAELLEERGRGARPGPGR